MEDYRLRNENPNKDIIYFRNYLEHAVMKQVNGEGIYIKYKNNPETLAGENNGIIEMALLEEKIDYITKEEYERGDIKLSKDEEDRIQCWRY